MSEFSMQLPYAPGHQVTGPNEAHVRGVVEDLTRQMTGRTQWPQDGEAAMTALARLFPSMAGVFGDGPVPGIDPWRPLALVRWLNSGAPTSGSRQAALFLLSVWNRDDWRVHGVKVRRGTQRIGRFDIADGFAAWDEQHRRAALAWLVNPFWP